MWCFPEKFVACHRTWRFIPGSLDLVEVDVSFQRFTAKHYHLERSPYCLRTRWEELWWKDFFSGEFSLERRVAEASWAGRFFFWGGEGIEQERLPCLVGCAEIREGYRPKTIASLPCEFLELVLLLMRFFVQHHVNVNRVDIHYAPFFSGLPEILHDNTIQYHQARVSLKWGNARVSHSWTYFISEKPHAFAESQKWWHHEGWLSELSKTPGLWHGISIHGFFW